MDAHTNKDLPNFRQRILEGLRELGLNVTADDIATHYDTASRWLEGGITLAELCRNTGWEIPEPADALQKVKRDAVDVRVAQSMHTRMWVSMIQAHDAGYDREEIVDAVSVAIRPGEAHEILDIPDPRISNQDQANEAADSTTNQ